MKKVLLLLIPLCAIQVGWSQVGINNTNPQSTLDISASNVATPSNTDGILIPRIDDFPATAPGIAQDGMMIFATGNGTPTKGFYYWDQNSTSWAAVSGSSGGTLDTAYDFGGAGAGRTITTDNGPVEITGDGGLQVDGLTDTHLLFVDPNIDNVGINSPTPGTTLDIVSTDSGSSTIPVVNIRTTTAEDGIGIRLSGTFTGVGENLDGILVTDFSEATGDNARTRGFSARMDGTSTHSGHNLRTFEAQITNSSNYIGDTFGFYDLNLSTTDGDQYGAFHGVSNSGNGEHYGAYSSMLGTGSGDKYGFYSNIRSTAGGTHYGLYSNVTNASGYAAYLIGRTSLGDGTTNRYLMPGADGSANQVLTTDGAGQISFATPLAYAERIDDLIDGKSDNDGTDDGSSIFFGINAGANDDGTDNRNIGIGFDALSSNTTGNLNIAIGHSAFESNLSGQNNTTVGFLSLASNTIGITNSAYGYQSMLDNISGNSNSAYGSQSLHSNTTGNSNVGIGLRAVYSNESGLGNVGVGFDSGYNALGSRNVFIGFSAGYFETGAHKLYIESSNANEDNALIYGEFDTNILRANGELQIGNPASGGYSLPTAIGTANQVLTSDGAGGTSWMNVGGESPSIVRATMSNNLIIPINSWAKLPYDTENFDTNSEFDPTNQRFTASTTGYYRINASFQSNGSGASNVIVSIGIFKNGVLEVEMPKAISAFVTSYDINNIVYLNTNDYVEMFAFNPSIFGTRTITVSAATQQSFYFEIEQID